MSSAITLSERARLLLEHRVEPPVNQATEAAPAPIRLAVEAALDRGETHYNRPPGHSPSARKDRRAAARPLRDRNQRCPRCNRDLRSHGSPFPGDPAAAETWRDTGRAVFEQATFRPRCAPGRQIGRLHSREFQDGLSAEQHFGELASVSSRTYARFSAYPLRGRHE